MQPAGPTIFKGSFEHTGTPFTREVSQMLERAERVGTEILTKDYSGVDHEHSCGHVRVIHHYHDTWWYPTWGYGPSYYTPPRRVTRDEKDREDRAALGVLFTLVILGTAYFAGKEWQINGEASEELERSSYEAKRFSHYKEAQEHHPLAEQIQRVQHLEQRIFSRIEQDSKTGLWMKGSMGVAAGAGLVGCVISAPAVIGAGVIGTVATGAGLLFRWGASNVAASNERDAAEILDDVQALRQAKV